MENYDYESESSSARVNIGIRISPELKEALNYEAFELDQSSSEYGESILHNRHKDKEEIDKFKQARSNWIRRLLNSMFQLRSPKTWMPN